MTLFEWSNQAFNVASVLYALAFVLYAGLLVSNKKIYTHGASWMARVAWGTHTLALLLRWAHAGIEHPPWTNLYESLVFFSWGVMGAHLYLEKRFGFKLSGVFASAVVFAAMGVASLHPHKEIEPLVPALQSWWLLFHVFMACIAYAFFLASSFVSVFFLLKDKVRLETMAAVAALVCILFLSIAVGKEFFLTSHIQFFKVLKMPSAAGSAAMQDVIMNFKGPDGKPIQQFISLPGAPYLVWPILALYLSSAISLLLPLTGKVKKARLLEKTGRVLFFLAFLLHIGLLVDIIWASRVVKDMNLKSNPYRLAGVIMTLGIAAYFSVLFKFKKEVLAKLPEQKVLDRWGYEAILLGVPFMTLNLISGGVWAYYAWGRYWGWDPKETWALITWFIYLIYLHMRILAGWKGRKTALISVLGFFVVIFTYLGVNLVISGLHSYATN